MTAYPDKEREQAATALSEEWAVAVPPQASFEALQEILAEKIRELMEKDPGKLIWLLYRLDISEDKVRELLARKEGDSAPALAQLMIERQWQKTASRNRFKKDPDISEEERW